MRNFFRIHTKNSILPLLIIIFFLSSANTFKPDSKKSEINQNNVKNANNNPNVKKECKTKERCRECTFDELKNTVECQATGYKTLKYCSYIDDNKKLVDEFYFTESCSDNMRVNTVYIFFFICVILGVVSFLIRKSHKTFILNQTLEKLTILRKDN